MQFHTIYDVSAPKKPVNVTANSDLIDRAKKSNLNLSETFEEAILAKLRVKLQQEWREDNQNGIEAYNERIERNGVFAAKHRRF